MKNLNKISMIYLLVILMLSYSSVWSFISESKISESTTVPEAVTGFEIPLTGSFSNNGGYSFLNQAVYNGNLVYHPGEDWNQPGVPGGCGTGCNSDMCLRVNSAAIGQVVYANPNSWGCIVVEHNYQGHTWYSQYGHVRNIIVSPGQIVSKGQKIAEIGNTGTDCAHLHFEIRKTTHPDPVNGIFFPYGNAGLGNINNVISWYESPNQFIASHPAYNNSVTAAFSVNNGNSLNGWKFWKTPPVPSNFYNIIMTIQNLPSGSNWTLYTAIGNNLIEPVATNQGGTSFNFSFPVSTSNSNYPNGGGYKFILTPQGQPGTVWSQSPSFYISSVPQLQVSVSPAELTVGQTATVSWTVTGGIPGLSYGGMTGLIRLQWHQNGTPKENLVTIPLSNNSFTFTVPSSIAGAEIPGCGFQISGSNEPGSSIPEGYVYGFSNNFCINVLTNTLTVNSEVPENFALYQNYPNPFNPVTKIKFDLPGRFSGSVIIDLFSIKGNRILTLLNENLSSGKYEISFDAKDLPSGIYIYRISTPEFSCLRSMMLVK